MDQKPIRVGVVGSREYKNAKKVKMTLEMLVEKYGKDNIIIVSGGCPTGGDRLGKNAALQLGLKYEEYPPAHREHNEYCVKGPEHYNKGYDMRHYFMRNTEIAENSDVLIAYLVSSHPCNGTRDTVTKFKGLGKEQKLVIFEDPY